MNELFFQELAKVLHDVLDEHRKRQEERIGNVSSEISNSAKHMAIFVNYCQIRTKFILSLNVVLVVTDCIECLG